VLILEDDPVQLAPLEGVVRELFLEPVGVRSPDLALAGLERAPVLAVVDLGMSLAPRGEHTVDEVLGGLYERCGGCCVLVYSVRADEIETKAARRLRNWLDRVGSRVRLVDHGHRCYGLHLST